MFSIKKHLTPSTAIAVLALVFAVTGGALAATGGGSPSHARLTASAAKAKAKTKAGPRGPAGKNGTPGATGPAGPAGPAGAAGVKGENGAAGGPGGTGKEGTNGTNGTSATTESFSGSTHPPCTTGGVVVKSASPEAVVCNGKNGTTGFTKTLPAGETEKGAWSLGPIAKATVPVSFGLHLLNVTVASFAIPLAEELESGHVHYINSAGEEVLETGPVPNTGACKGGTAVNPTAEPGNLCVYATEENETSSESGLIFNPSKPRSIPEGEAGKTGAYALFLINGENASGAGTWAVTAE